MASSTLRSPAVTQRMMGGRRWLGDRRAFSASAGVLAGGKNKIKVTSKGKFKDHRLGGPGMEEAFDIERDLATPFAMQDVPATTHLRWAEARKRLEKLRAIKFQMPALAKYQQPFVPPPPEAHVIVRTQDDMGFHRGKQDSQRPNTKASISVNLSKIPALAGCPRAMHKFKLLSGRRWFESRARSVYDTSEHHGLPHGTVRIACGAYPSLEMNQKRCSDLLDRLLEEAVSGEDPMADIPLDPTPSVQRRHRAKHRPWALHPARHSPLFPAHWLPEPVRARLRASQHAALNILRTQKSSADTLDQNIRALLSWDGIGIAPPSLFDNLPPHAKLQLQQLLNQRSQISNLSAPLDRNFHKTFDHPTPPTP